MFFLIEYFPPQALSRQTAVGMKPKKIHEVSYFASIVSSLGKEWDIYRAVDIGAGQGVGVLFIPSCTDPDKSS